MVRFGEVWQMLALSLPSGAATTEAITQRTAGYYAAPSEQTSWRGCGSNETNQAAV